MVPPKGTATAIKLSLRGSLILLKGQNFGEIFFWNFFSAKIFGGQNILLANFLGPFFLLQIFFSLIFLLAEIWFFGYIFFCDIVFVKKKILAKICYCWYFFCKIFIFGNFFSVKIYFFGNSWNMFKMVPGTYLWSLVEIGSVRSQILLIWTDITRTNIAWTDVIVTVEICL